MSKRQIVVSKQFLKAYKKFTLRNSTLLESVDNALLELEEDVFSAKLKTHKLSGILKGSFACSCGYDCRIVFTIEKDKKTKKEVILLIDIGTHEEVY